MTNRQENAGRDLGSRASCMVLLAPICVFAFMATLTAPVSVDSGIPTIKVAEAKGGNGGGNGNGNGNNKDKKGGGDGAADPEASIGAEGEVDGGSEAVAAEIPLVAEDIPPANVEVIREVAGLPEHSGLSEEEELEAIRNGWGNWRTADAPANTAIQ